MADVTDPDVVTVTLVASTHTACEITGPGKRVELVHHGNVADVVYFLTSATDPVDVLVGAGAEGEHVLLPGERLVVNCPRDENGADAKYVELWSAGVPVVSVVNLPGGY